VCRRMEKHAGFRQGHKAACGRVPGCIWVCWDGLRCQHGEGRGHARAGPGKASCSCAAGSVSGSIPGADMHCASACKSYSTGAARYGTQRWHCACAQHLGHQPATHEHLAGVAVAQGKTRVGDQVGQAVGAAQQTSLAVVGEALLSALNGGLQGQGGGRASLVLRGRRRAQGRCTGQANAEERCLM
jgi:hypothetical protein